jgi:ribonuclease D
VSSADGVAAVHDGPGAPGGATARGPGATPDSIVTPSSGSTGDSVRATTADGGTAPDENAVPDENAALDENAVPHGPPPTPLDHPRDGTPEPITTPTDLLRLAEALAAGRGPVALDAERASGFRYGGRAFLVQLRRDGVGTALVDPAALPDLAVLDAPLAGAEWVLHAANQDLPCLAELGLRPRTLFDTELAGRLAGLPRVGLGPLVERMLGLHLAKGHGADDWSRRPLPPDWLDYAALDVEVLVELRDAMAELLERQGKLEWARQEFAAIVAAPIAPPRVDPWRRPYGIHRLTDRRTLAMVRELWTARDELARRRDLAPHRVLPDSAIVAAATSKPTSTAALAELPVFSGRVQRRQGSYWLAALDRARALPATDLPPARLPSTEPPAAGRWASKDPDAAARLSAARAGFAALSERVQVPVENLLSPHLVRALMWRPPADAVAAALAAGGARPWQIELTAPLLTDALGARA